MNDAVRGMVLLASVLLWSPFLMPVVAGTMSVEQGLLRYAAALALAWAGGAGLSALVRSYTPEAKDADAEAESDDDGRPLRRVEDAVE